DKQLLPYVLNKLTAIEPAFADQIEYVERLENFDAVIATGSNNSSRYFEYYFSKVPHIIRKNRNSVAILSGDETDEELLALGADIFDYFGLGCRNVSKIFIPKGYNFNRFFEAIAPYKTIAEHHKYINNYDYNKSIYLVNGETHLDNGFLLLKPDETLASPLAVLYYEEYDDLKSLEAKLAAHTDEIQCVASMHAIELKNQVVPFGYTQKPRLWDYADGVDLIQFLMKGTDTIAGK
ncbi:MAG: acyl-CoA reductase, partial [Sphingobacteriaceae bacterium]